jgi:predicted metal-binding membrane protein
MMLHSHHGHNGSVNMMLAHNIGSIALGWSLMLVAMMLPVLIIPIRYVRDRSFSHRRGRAEALFVAGYAFMWLAAGVVLVVLAMLIRTSIGNPLALTILSLTLVLTWQFSPLKQHCLNQGHTHPPLAAFGAAADLDVLKFGLVHGFWCVGSCWGLMSLPMLLPIGHLFVMAVVSLWIWGEHFDRLTPPNWRIRVPIKAMRLTVAQTRILLLQHFGNPANKPGQLLMP